MSEVEVLAAAANLVERFGAFDREGYFACFAEDASFIFYNSPHRLTSRMEYEALWDDWVREGWRVTSCTSSDQLVQRVSSDVAVFTHNVATTFAGEDEVHHERETIVFARNVEWRAIHEHLSPLLT